MKVILTENQIKNKLINESYDSEYDEYGELIDIEDYFTDGVKPLRMN